MAADASSDLYCRTVWPAWNGGKGIPMPVDLVLKDLTTSASDFVVSLKYDGERFIFINYLQRGTMVSRAGVKYNLGPTRAGSRNCILDGEMVWTNQKNKWGGKQFSVFDMVAIQDKFVGESSYETRLEVASLILPELANEKCEMSIKPVVPAERFRELKCATGIATDGLVFTMKEDPIVAGRAATIKKWKPPHLQTVDLLVRGDRLMCLDRGCYVPVDVIYDKSLKFAQEQVHEFALTRTESSGLQAAFVRSRPDKKNPNSIATFTAVVECVFNPISHQDLVKWTERQIVAPRVSK